MTVVLQRRRSEQRCRRGLHDVSQPGALRPDGSCHQCRLAYQREWASDLRVELLALLDAEKVRRGCAHCGYNANPHGLQWDHLDPVLRRTKHGDRRAVRSSARNRAEAERLMNDPNVQVLCGTCHAIKSHENGDYTAGRV